MNASFKNIIRALRLPFASASILPFIFGSLLARPDFSRLKFVLGFFAVLGTHLGANLINDYADAKSGVDWKDRHFYKFFGGSKLIQEKVFSARFYRNLALFLSVLAGLAVVTLAVLLKSLAVVGWFLLILFLGWSYSEKPLQFSYRRLGEPVIFILFGPALVMGGYFIQTGIFPALKSFILALPYGFLTVAILYANEVPDYPDDQKCGKLNWVSLTGREKAFIVYFLLVSLAFFAVALGIILGYLSLLSCLAFLLIIAPLKATAILKRHYADKIRLIKSSKLTILTHTLVSGVLILDTVL